jgi:AcrR family transcriptional regulator
MNIDALASRRPYRMQARAEAAEATRVRILEAAIALHRERYYDEITLQEVANLAGVSLQTVIRRFGSKEGLLSAASEHKSPAIAAAREAVPQGDIDAVVEVLIPHYEADGDATFRLLSLEERIPAVRQALQYGKDFHRSWIARTFKASLPAPGSPDFERRVALLVAATDLSTWKLLRRDLGLSRMETARAMREMLERLIRS